jgi:hypothetical protein
MVKISTLLYICDNLENDEDKLIDLESITYRGNAEFKEVWDFLDNLILEVDQDIVKKVLNQICQL